MKSPGMAWHEIPHGFSWREEAQEAQEAQATSLALPRPPHGSPGNPGNLGEASPGKIRGDFVAAAWWLVHQPKTENY